MDKGGESGGFRRRNPTQQLYQGGAKMATLGQRTRVTRDGLGTQCPGRAASATHTFPFAMNGEAGALNAG